MTRSLAVANLSNFPNESFDLEVVERKNDGHVVELPKQEAQNCFTAGVSYLDPPYEPDDYILVKITATGDNSGDHQGVGMFVYNEGEYSKTVLDNGDIHFEKVHRDSG